MTSRASERLLTGFAPRYIKLNQELQAVADGKLEQYITETLPQFNTVNLVTALHRLASTSQTRLARKVLSRLVTALPHDPECNTHTWGNVSWAIGKLRLPAQPLLGFAVDHLTQKSEKAPQELANVVWALARTRHTVTPLVELICTTMPPLDGSTDARHIGSICSSFGNQAERVTPGMRTFVEQAGTAMVRTPLRFTPQQMCNIVWSAAKVGTALPPLHVITIDRCNAQELALLLWSVATSATNVAPSWVDAVVCALRAQEMNSQDVASTIWALVKLRACTHIDALVGLPAVLRTPRHAATIAQALSHIHADGPNARAFLRHLSLVDGEVMGRTWPPRAIANTIYALAKLRIESPLFATLGRTWTATADLTTQECANVLWAYATAHSSGPLIGALERQSDPLRMRPEELASTAWAFTVLKHSPTDMWRVACAESVGDMKHFKPQELGILLRALSKLHTPSRVFSTMASNLMARPDLKQFSGRDIIECLCSFQMELPLACLHLLQHIQWDATVDDIALMRCINALQHQRIRLRGASDSLLTRARAALLNPLVYGRVLCNLAKLDVPKLDIIPHNPGQIPPQDIVSACFAWCLWHTMPPLWLLRLLPSGARNSYQLQCVSLAMFGAGTQDMVAESRPENTKLHTAVLQTLHRLHCNPMSEVNARRSGLLIDIVLPP